jgi:cytochrome bd ubiquinol oxidase subunit II
MVTPEVFAAGTILVSLIIYVLSGGADYGGGVWDLFAVGVRAKDQRALIAHAIGPIWEANHVWLILAVVVLFTAFPAAFAAIMISLHVPLVLALIGIVLRGSAFVFRAYDPKPSGIEQLWQRIFAISSLLTPFLLGVCAGAVAAGRVQPKFGFIAAWASPFPIAVGFYAVTLFAYLAAVYLTNEDADYLLKEDFRRRALSAWFAVSVGGAIVLWLWHPFNSEGANQSVTVLLQAAGEISAVISLTALWKRRWRLAQLFAAIQTALVVAGCGAAQYPFLVPPTFLIEASAAPAATLRALQVALIAGGAILFPSFLYLFAIFKRAQRT